MTKSKFQINDLSPNVRKLELRIWDFIGYLTLRFEICLIIVSCNLELSSL